MKIVKHLNETDPAKVAIGESVFNRSFEIAMSKAPSLCAAIQGQTGFIVNIYDEHLGMVDEIIDKYEEHADLVWRCGYHHPSAGPVIALGFRCHPGVDLTAMMSSKLGVTFPD